MWVGGRGEKGREFHEAKEQRKAVQGKEKGGDESEHVYKECVNGWVGWS